MVNALLISLCGDGEAKSFLKEEGGNPVREIPLQGQGGFAMWLTEGKKRKFQGH